MTERSNATGRLQDALIKIRKRGIRAEQVAVTLDVSHSSIEKWKSGQRFPKLPTIRLLESVYKVKIL